MSSLIVRGILAALVVGGLAVGREPAVSPGPPVEEEDRGTSASLFDPELRRTAAVLFREPAKPPPPSYHQTQKIHADHTLYDEAPRKFIELLNGAYFSSSLGPDTPDFHYAPVSLRLGCRPFYCGDDSWRDRCSALLDFKAAPVLKGPGDFLLGPSLLLRYDFRSPSAVVVPYIQGGAGVVFTNAHLDMTQRAIGSPVEFLLEAAIGARIRCSDRLFLIFEGGYQHISNANLAERNSGINNFGASVGVMIVPGRRH